MKVQPGFEPWRPSLQESSGANRNTAENDFSRAGNPVHGTAKVHLERDDRSVLCLGYITLQHSRSTVLTCSAQSVPNTIL